MREPASGGEGVNSTCTQGAALVAEVHKYLYVLYSMLTPQMYVCILVRTPQALVVNFHLNLNFITLTNFC